jgi:Xaa-Pro aminopeptidase
MHIKPVALLTGPYDWDPDLLPIAEFEARLAAVRGVIRAHNVSALIVHGNSAESGALAYLTNFAPKLGPAFGLVPRDGPIRLLVSGSPAMLPAAQRLTWVEDIRPISDLKQSIEYWLTESVGTASPQIALWGDNKMALRPYQALVAAIEPRGSLADINAPLENLRIHKSPLELKLIGRSCEVLAAATAELRRSFHTGLGARSIALAAELAAYRAGAQDARVFISARPGGPPQFIDFVDDPILDPLLADIAVRFAGYWSEGSSSLSRTR